MLCWQLYLLALMAGLACSPDPWTGGAVLVVGLLLAWDRLGEPVPRTFAALCLAAGFGLGLAWTPPPSPPAPEWMENREIVRVSGIVDQVEGRYDQRLRIVLRDVSVLGAELGTDPENVSSGDDDNGHGANEPVPDSPPSPDAGSNTVPVGDAPAETSPPPSGTPTIGIGADADQPLPGTAPPSDGSTPPRATPLPTGLAWTWDHPAFRPEPGAQVLFDARISPIHNLANPGGWDLETHWALQGVGYRCYTRSDTEVLLLSPSAPSRPEAPTPETAAMPIDSHYREQTPTPSGNYTVPHPPESTSPSQVATSSLTSPTSPSDPRSVLLPNPGTMAPERGSSSRLVSLLTRAGGSEDDSARDTLTQGQAVLVALITGDRFHIDSEVADLFARAGLAHVLARSGLHLGLVALWGVFLAWLVSAILPSVMLRIPRPKLAVLLAAPLVILYALSGQPSPSLYRALVMYMAWGGLLLMNRRGVLLDGLVIALALALANGLLFAPHSLTDLSLTLSVAAVAGIILCLKRFAPLLAGLRKNASRPGRLGLVRTLLAWGASMLLVSLTAQLAVLPLVVESFGRISPHIHLNLVILPLLHLVVMPLGLLGWALSAIPGLDTLAARLLGAASTCLDGFIAGLSHVDGAQGLPQLLIPRLGWPGWIGFWGLILLILTRPGSQDRRPSAWPRPLAALLCTGLILLPLARGYLAGHDGTVRMTVLDVGQGQSILVDTGHGSRVLIDGGGFFSDSFDSGRDLVAPFLIRQRLPRVETVVNTHPHRDHVRGLLYILEGFSVDRFVHNGQAWEDSADEERLKAILSRRPVDVSTARAGDVIELGGGLTLEVLHPGLDFTVRDGNEQSLVLRLVRDGQGLALIPGDVEQAGIARLMELYGREQLAARVLVLPHHGSRTSLDQDFYDRVSPELALASCGYLNYWRLPSAEVRAALEQGNIPLLTTAESGAVTIAWPGDGSPMEMDTAR